MTYSLYINVPISVCVCVCVSQLFGGGGEVFGELGEPEVGAVDHVGFTATLSRTHRLAVALVVQTPVFGSWKHQSRLMVSTGPQWTHVDLNDLHESLNGPRRA